jgi:hypothetical protein
MDALEETIKDIAIKHGIVVGRDDPILVLHTMNERLFQENQVAQQALLDSFKSEMESIAQAWDQTATLKAERTLSAALKVSKDMMIKSVENSVQIATESIQAEMSESVISALLRSQRETRRMTIINLVAASLTLAAAIIVFLTFV